MRPFFSLRLAVLAFSCAMAPFAPRRSRQARPKPYVNDDLAVRGRATGAEGSPRTARSCAPITPPAELQRQLTDAALRNDLPQH